MYIWELLMINSKMIAIIGLSLMYSFYMGFLITLLTNPYWKELNNRQKKYWLISITTGTTIPLYALTIIGAFIFYCTNQLTIYLSINYPSESFSIPFFFSCFVLIILAFWWIGFGKNGRIIKLLSMPLNLWENICKEQLGFNIYFKEKKEGE